MSRPKNPRLQFTDAEREDPRLKEHIRRADKAADQADAARKKVPKKKKPVKQRTVDPATGTVDSLARPRPACGLRKWTSPRRSPS